LVAPIPDHTFLSSRISVICSTATSFKPLRLAPDLLDPIGRHGPRRVADEPTLTGLQETFDQEQYMLSADAFASAKLDRAND